MLRPLTISLNSRLAATYILLSFPEITSTYAGEKNSASEYVRIYQGFRKTVQDGSDFSDPVWKKGVQLELVRVLECNDQDPEKVGELLLVCLKRLHQVGLSPVVFNEVEHSFNNLNSLREKREGKSYN